MTETAAEILTAIHEAGPSLPEHARTALIDVITDAQRALNDVEAHLALALGINARNTVLIADLYERQRQLHRDIDQAEARELRARNALDRLAGAEVDEP